MIVIGDARAPSRKVRAALRGSRGDFAHWPFYRGAQERHSERSRFAGIAIAGVDGGQTFDVMAVA
jgi:hypothetical protein